jgi:hypothetical protein
VRRFTGLAPVMVAAQAGAWKHGHWRRLCCSPGLASTVSSASCSTPQTVTSGRALFTGIPGGGFLIVVNILVFILHVHIDFF